MIAIGVFLAGLGWLMGISDDDDINEVGRALMFVGGVMILMRVCVEIWDRT